MEKTYLITQKQLDSLILLEEDLFKKDLAQEFYTLFDIIDNIFYNNEQISDILGTK